MNVANICACISCAIAFASVCASIYAVVQSRKTALTGTYFSEMSSAYSEFLKCAADFVFQKGFDERDALAAALYRLQLFASEKISSDAQLLYLAVIDWAQTGTVHAREIDHRINQLGVLMRDDLAQFRKTGHH